MKWLKARTGRVWGVYGAVAGMEPKVYLAYPTWVTVDFAVQIISITVFVYFWRAVYAGGGTIAGLNLGQTLNYILVAQMLMPLVTNRLIFFFGQTLREGSLATELTRPVDFQGSVFAGQLSRLAIELIMKIPLIVLAVVLFGLRLPTDPAVYLVFFVSLVLGFTVLFFFDWTFSCLAFYTTETWGLSVVREGVALFFSGAMVPLAIMPVWLQAIAGFLPFAQALYVPASLLSGITPLSAAPQALLVQLAWLAGLLLVSRLAFATALRVVTVQGG